MVGIVKQCAGRVQTGLNKSGGFPNVPVLKAVHIANGRPAEVERLCPGVGREWIGSLLTDLKAAGILSCRGKGPAARWRYLGSKGIKSE